MKVIPRPSPNCNARPHGEVSLVVLHADAAPNEEATLSWITAPISKVSYHTFISRKGEVYAIVPAEKRAWHAGVSEHEGRPNVNDFSVGLCFANRQDGVEPFTDAQYEVGALYLASLVAAYPGLAMYDHYRVTTHQACARPVGRKHDPGPLFDVARLLAGVRAALSAVQPIAP